MNNVQPASDEMLLGAHMLQIVYTIGRCGLATIFLVAGLNKLRNPYAFLISIYQFEIFTAGQSRWLAATLPFLEIILGICLLINIFQRAVALLVPLLLLAFVCALASIVVRGIKTSCGCFGEAETADVGWWTVVRSIGLLLLGVMLAYSGSIRRPYQIRFKVVLI